ncbi:MAG: hemolysin family protein [Syntrophales bacterium]|nr:hemolysin family protein [Syntrophales bacterium]
MSEIFSDIAVLFFLVLINGIFSLSEIAVVSSRKTKLKIMADQRKKWAARALELAEEPSHFLSTIQVGITLVGVISGAYGGAVIAQDLGVYLRHWPLIGPYSEIVSITLVVAVITYLSIVVGELIPKRLALQNPEQVASLISVPIHYFSLVVYPAVKILSASSEFIVRLLGLKKPVTTVSEEEVKVLLEEGTEAGVFHQMEHDIIHGAFEIDDLSVKDVMTPRPDIVWLDLEAPWSETLMVIKGSDHASFPVCEGELDHVIGFLHVKDLFKRYPDLENINLRSILRKPFIFPETITALKLLEHFKASPIHAALIVDEYGTVQGLVTVNDIIEAIVGDIPSFKEAEDDSIVKREDGTWLVDGTLSIEEFREKFHISSLPEEEDREYHTIAGFILTYLGRLPVAGDKFTWDRFEIEILDMDGNRIDKILVKETSMPTQ